MTVTDGEKPIETASDLLCAGGALLFGDRWKSALANMLGVSPRTMKRWASGEVKLDFGHGVFGDLRNQLKLEVDALQHKRLALIALEEQLTTTIANLPNRVTLHF